MKSVRNEITRRDFMKRSALGTMGMAAGMGAISGCLAATEARDTFRYLRNAEFPTPKEVSPIKPVSNEIYSTSSVAQSSKAVKENGAINQAIVQQMFDEAIFACTGKDSIEAAWDTLVPGLKSTDTIGLKINCINPSLPTHPEVINAIIDHLKKIGINENNIIVWDRRNSNVPGLGNLARSGYTINSGDKGVRYIHTDMDNIGYDDDIIVRVPTVDLELSVSKILTRECKYLINVPQLRHHGRAGMTQCLKNYYGTIPLFGVLTATIAAKMHLDNCNPAAAELFSNSIFKEKTILHVCDALMTIYEGGPMGGPQTIVGKLMVGRDPVALDHLGLMILEEERKKRGFSTLTAHSRYIQTAAEMGIGTNNPRQITIKPVTI